MDVSVQSQLMAQNYIFFASIAVTLYECAITFDDEKRFVWSRWRLAGSRIYLVNRYVVLLSSLSWLATFYPWKSIESCTAFAMYRQVTTGIIEFIVILSMLLRLYALYGQDKRILVLGIMMMFGMIGAASWGFSGGGSSTVVLSPGCHIFSPSETGLKYVVGWASIIGADILIFILTVLKTWAAMRGPNLRGGNLSVLILRDGAIYYIAVTCLNLANLTTFFVLPDTLQGCVGFITGNVSSTMLSRMMINLHKSIANSRGLVADDNIPVIPAQSHSQHSDGTYGKEGKLMYSSAFNGSLSGTGYGQMGPVSTV